VVLIKVRWRVRVWVVGVESRHRIRCIGWKVLLIIESQVWWWKVRLKRWGGKRGSAGVGGEVVRSHGSWYTCILMRWDAGWIIGYTISVNNVWTGCSVWRWQMLVTGTGARGGSVRNRCGCFGCER
jgi:hypothetical protein